MGPVEVGLRHTTEWKPDGTTIITDQPVGAFPKPPPNLLELLNPKKEDKKQ